MIATRRFVFLHLHKSGGTFVNECLMRHFDDAERLGYHLPRKLIPPTLQHLPVLGFVRNPWSYYVSWYEFQAAKPQPNPLFRVLSANRTLDFRGTIRNMLALSRNDRLLNLVLGALPSGYTGGGLNLPRFALEPIRQTGLGFYSYLYRYMYSGGTNSLHIGRMESLRDELLRMLAAVEQPLTDAARAYIVQRAPANASVRSSSEGYYDEELRELVATVDADVIAQHGYAYSGS